MMTNDSRSSTEFRTLALLGALLLAVSCTACGKDTTSASAAGRAKAQEPRPVRVLAAEVGRLPRTVTVTGTLAADEEVVAGFKVAGRVSEIAVDLGSPVRKGQVLARLDPTDFLLRVEQAEAALRQVRAGLGLPRDGSVGSVDPEKTALVREARAVLEEARLNRDRTAQLWEKNYIARSEADASVSRLLVAESRYQAALEEIRNRQELLAERGSGLALARQQLADAVLSAPIDGAVRERKASVGEYLAAGAPVLALVRVYPLRLRVAVPERDASSVRVGQAVRVLLEGDPTVHAGRVARLSPSIQEQNRTLIVEAEVANPDGKLRPGSFARAEIVVEADRTAVMVPASTVVTFAGLEKVFVVKDGKAVEQRIRTGRRSGDRIEILEGVAAGEPVVTDPGNLVGGTPVTVTR
ncbi:MAG: efflux RND transporter periplasmic adaptor subunit [Deltaproteobacteria bacterium]|nr:efflux RND transporter periplasmic adaptor subunit [Deltaproteobacteria bacterium]